MRSQSFLQKSRLLVEASPSRYSSLRLSQPRSARRPYHKQQPPPVPSRAPARHLASSTPISEFSGPLEPPNPPENSNAEPPPDVPEKPRLRRTRVAVAPSKDSEPIELPEDLDILWTPDGEGPQQGHLPPPEIFEDALNNLLITLHPQTQHRATYSSPLGPPTEPTLGLYCPIEGGEYIIDATVRELAHRTGAEVLVLDAAQLAAGEWGQFGAAANSLSLSRNPLHFPSSPSVHTQASRNIAAEEDDDSDVPPQLFSPPQQMTLTLMTQPSAQGRTILTSAPRRNSPPSKVKVFFDTLINTPSKPELSGATSSTKPRPRLIYIRDFPTLAPMTSAWYPPLLSAVRERRRGPISRPTSPVVNPMTIIFGMTPSLMPPTPEPSSNNGVLSLLMNRSPATNQVPNEPRNSKPDWGEGEFADKAREKRLRDRLRKWEKGDTALYDEFVKLSTAREGESTEERPEIIVIGGGNGIPGLPPVLGTGMPPSASARQDHENSSSFFRTSVLVPGVRSVNDEKATRVARRREINELTLRMGVGAAGGVLERESAQAVHISNSLGDEKQPSSPDVETSQSDALRMWEDWGNRIEVWSNVRRIADRALGNTLSATQMLGNVDSSSLDSTSVSWHAVHKAWAVHRLSKDVRRSWLKDSSLSKLSREHVEDEEALDEEQETVDEVIERVKNGDLDPHEQRLLPCIVDSASMPTSFSQVHLPPHTIDSVRTIVSLPLLHPEAFQQGILKEHSMTGCLLFGPPGTGKTLVVRALAKEAGCRMMAISPSDVMDMYVGEGEKLVKAVFSLARKLSPCVVFLDEIDALFGARMSSRDSGGAFAHRGVITEFMQEMDGLKSSKEDSVIVIGATNRPFDLDDAVLRRLPRRLLVDLPGEKEREEILKILLREELLADDLDIRTLAAKTESFSGSDLKHLCVSAALDAVKENVILPWSPLVNKDTDSVHVQGSIDEVSNVQSLVSNPLNDPPPSDESLTSGTSVTSQLPIRVLHLHNFTKALKEIIPSSSELLGSLAELRKWNDEFGEGRRDRKRRQVWGRGRFGFTDQGDKGNENGKVLHSSSDATA